MRAEEALAIGLVDRVVAPGAARSAAEALAHELAASPWECLSSDRRALFEGLDRPLGEAMANEFERGMETIRRTGLAGAEAFTRRRGP